MTYLVVYDKSNVFFYKTDGWFLYTISFEGEDWYTSSYNDIQEMTDKHPNLFVICLEWV